MDEVYICLRDIGYEAKHLSENVCKPYFCARLHFVEIVKWLNSQLVSLCGIRSFINPSTKEGIAYENYKEFLIQTSSLLQDLKCPLKKLTTGPVENRLSKDEDKIIAMIYLCTEVKAMKMQLNKKFKKKKDAQIQCILLNTAKELKDMLVSLNLKIPTANLIYHLDVTCNSDTTCNTDITYNTNITCQKIFKEIESKIKYLSQPQEPGDVIGGLLLTDILSEKQWFALKRLHEEMCKEYKIRRLLLLTRLDVTIKCFLWSEQAIRYSDKIEKINTLNRKIINDFPRVKISDVLSAGTNSITTNGTSDAFVRRNCKHSINKVQIGPVPDRGGRPSEDQKQCPKNNLTLSFDKDQTTYPPKKEKYAKHIDNTISLQVDDFNSCDRRINRRYSSPTYSFKYRDQEHLQNSPFGFSGFIPASDNYHQFGVSERFSRKHARFSESNCQNYPRRSLERSSKLFPITNLKF